MLSDGLSPGLLKWSTGIGVPVVAAEQLPRLGEACQLAEYVRKNEQLAAALQLRGRSQIRLGAPADLLLLRSSGVAQEATAIEWSDLQQVVLAGYVVSGGTDSFPPAAGKFLRWHG